MIFVDRIAFGGGPIAFQGNWQDPTFHGHPTLNYNYGSFDGCSYIYIYMQHMPMVSDKNYVLHDCNLHGI